MHPALVIQLARFGDLVQTKRLVRSIEAAGRTAHLLVDASLAALAEAVYPKARVHAIHAHAAGGIEPAQAVARLSPVLAELREHDFAEVYTLNFSGLSFALARAFAPERVRGYACPSGQPVKDRWSELAFRWTRLRRQAAVNLADFWAHLHPCPLPGEQVNPPPTPGGGGLGVVLAGRNARRSLPAEVLATAVHAAWSATGKGRVLLLGGPGEVQAAEALRLRLPAQVREACVNLAGTTKLAEMPATLVGLDMLLTPDTGTMHLAAHLGIPVTAVFLSSAWCHETGPYGAGHTVWQAAAPCAPCLEREPCSRELACLAPFRSREFLRRLSGGAGEAPGLVCLTSSFDGLGVRFLAEGQPEDGESVGRRRFREFLIRHLHAGEDNLPPDADLAARLYLERDWMTPAREEHMRRLTPCNLPDAMES